MEIGVEEEVPIAVTLEEANLEDEAEAEVGQKELPNFNKRLKLLCWLGLPKPFESAKNLEVGGELRANAFLLRQSELAVLMLRRIATLMCTASATSSRLWLEAWPVTA
jgi:hypothetical protein